MDLELRRAIANIFGGAMTLWVAKVLIGSLSPMIAAGGYEAMGAGLAMLLGGGSLIGVGIYMLAKGVSPLIKLVQRRGGAKQRREVERVRFAVSEKLGKLSYSLRIDESGRGRLEIRGDAGRIELVFESERELEDFLRELENLGKRIERMLKG